MKPIEELTKELKLSSSEYEPYGYYKAKLNGIPGNKKNGKLILVTSISPTKQGNGKTVTTISLAMGLRKIGKSVIATLREPSLGPNFGMKGGAAGGGKAILKPADDINLHFTGDFHAITAANNMLVALAENYRYIHQGKPEGLKTITLKRCLDVNDRSLRQIITGMGASNGAPMETGFVITPASDLMAVFCLSKDLNDLQKRVGRMIVGYNYNGEAITTDKLGVTGAIVALLKDAFKPNLVQTAEGGPALVHGGPFANIAHGCNSLVATQWGLHLADYTITEAGFGSDLGAEKFFNIKCRTTGFNPSLSVLVVTIPALKLHGKAKGSETVEAGLWNLERHIHILQSFNQRVLVALNQHIEDTPKEIATVEAFCLEQKVPFVTHQGYAKGGDGALQLAEIVCNLTELPERPLRFTYGLEDSFLNKIHKIATTIYGAGKVSFSTKAQKQIEKLEIQLENLAICMAKTQYSFTDQPNQAGLKTGFTLHVDDIYLNAGAGFVVVQCGDIMLMPGLPKEPRAKQIQIINNEIKGI
ncbi:MAG: formate--tetrahydrofolate ligase [Flavobacteriales bacterium]|nr:formate--tetrahydrofolate ligase [Flavobacteriales bacterium]